MLLMGFAHVYEVLVDDVVLYLKECDTSLSPPYEQSPASTSTINLKKFPGVVVTPLSLNMVSGANDKRKQGAGNLSHGVYKDSKKPCSGAGAISSSDNKRKGGHEGGDRRLRKKPYSTGASGVKALVTLSSRVAKKTTAVPVLSNHKGKSRMLPPFLCSLMVFVL
jgi:hypothetical protein